MQRFSKPNIVYKIIETEGAEMTLDASEVRVESLPYTIERKLETHGVFFQLDVNELTFLGSAARFVERAYISRGLQARLDFSIAIRVNGRFKIFEPKKIDMTSYKMSAKGEVTVALLDTSFIEESEKAKSRNKLVVPDSDVVLRSQRVRLRSTGYLPVDLTSHNVEVTVSGFFESLPVEFEIREAQRANDLFTYEPDQDVFTSIKNQDSDITISYSLKGVMTIDYGITLTSGQFTLYIQAFLTVYDKDRNVVAQSTIERIGEQYIDDATGINTPISVFFEGIDISYQATVPPGGTVALFIEFNPGVFFPASSVLTVDYDVTNKDDNSIKIEDQTLLDDTVSKAVTVNQAFRQVLNNRFYSDYFTTGCGKDLVLVKGSWIRLLNQSRMYLNFKNLFDNLARILGLGYGYEKLGSEVVVRVEPIEYFYSSDEPVVTFTDIEKYSITETVGVDFAYNKIKVGYKNLEYNSSNAATEDFHTTHSYETPLTGIVTKELNLVSDFVASGFGIRAQQLRLAQQTSDSDLDDKIFIVSLIADLKISKRDEGYIDVSGIFAADTAMNLDLSPKRNLIRHYQLFSSSMQKALNTEVFEFSGAERNFTLVTETVDSCHHSGQVSEESDMPSKGLVSPLFTNEKIVLDGLQGFDQLDAVINNPYAPVTFFNGKAYINGYVVAIKGDDLRRNNFNLQLIKKFE